MLWLVAALVGAQVATLLTVVQLLQAARRIQKELDRVSWKVDTVRAQNRGLHARFDTKALNTPEEGTYVL